MLTVKNLKRLHIGPVGFTVADGECLAITGPSGAGKSVLLRAIVDLDPSTGEAFTAKVNRATAPAPEWRQHVAMLPAETGWWSDDVSAHFQHPEATEKSLPLVGLSPDAMQWQIPRLSTGERHRLGLLRCLENNPSVLLLDEPTAALDAETTGLVESLLKKQMSEGVSIVVVTHDPQQAERLGGATKRLENGALI